MRYGRLYAEACLHPLTEQLVGVLDLRDNHVVCDLLCDGGPIIAAVAPGLASGTIIAVERDLRLAGEAIAAAGRGATCVMRTALSDGARIGLPDASCDRVVAMLTLGFGDPGSLLLEAQRILRRAGGIACVMWDDATPPLHEAALAGALREVAHHASPFLAEVLAGAPEVRGLATTPLRDVVRFDGIDQYWHALVTERPLAQELADLSADTLQAVRAHVAAALQPCTAADGTMRVPVTAQLIRS